MELLGVGSGDGSLEKLVIRRTPAGDRGRRIEALFNPNEINISRSVRYEQKEIASGREVFAEQKLRSVEPATLTVDLFFDTYEDRKAVTKLTRDIEALALPDKNTHQPPKCELTWGRFDIFEGVLTQLNQRFTMFVNDGTPVRATLACTFVESRSKAYRRATEMHSADVAKTRVVRRNDTLQSIAAEQYEDPALWRSIAKANGIVNPRDVQPGTVLMIPKLRP
jgi:nucleoid-associated protein YgaU